MNYRDRINEVKTKHQFALDRKKKEEEFLEEATEKYEASKKALDFIVGVAHTIQQNVHQSISRIVCRCLESVFDNPYEFLIDFQVKRNKTEAELVMRRDGIEFRDPKREVGMGMIDVASLGLRVACIVLSQPRMDRVLILDEPFKNVRGQENKARLRNLLLTLATEMGFQFILNVDVEAYPEFALGKIVEVGQ